MGLLLLIGAVLGAGYGFVKLATRSVAGTFVGLFGLAVALLVIIKVFH
jgi:hypothetical protein